MTIILITVELVSFHWFLSKSKLTTNITSFFFYLPLIIYHTSKYQFFFKQVELTVTTIRRLVISRYSLTFI